METVLDTEMMITLSATSQTEEYLQTTKAEVYVCTGLILLTSVSKDVLKGFPFIPFSMPQFTKMHT